MDFRQLKLSYRPFLIMVFCVAIVVLHGVLQAWLDIPTLADAFSATSNLEAFAYAGCGVAAIIAGLAGVTIATLSAGTGKAFKEFRTKMGPTYRMVMMFLFVGPFFAALAFLFAGLLSSSPMAGLLLEFGIGTLLLGFAYNALFLYAVVGVGEIQQATDAASRHRDRTERAIEEQLSRR